MYTINKKLIKLLLLFNIYIVLKIKNMEQLMTFIGYNQHNNNDQTQHSSLDVVSCSKQGDKLIHEITSNDGEKTHDKQKSLSTKYAHGEDGPSYTVGTSENLYGCGSIGESYISSDNKQTNYEIQLIDNYVDIIIQSIY
jgi:hypothetical protein